MAEYEHSSWNDAIENVNAGNVALKNNQKFRFWNFWVYPGTEWDTKIYPMPGSEVILNIETNPVGTESYVEFKDGSKYGMTLRVKPDYTNMTSGEVDYWFYRADAPAENIYQTISGQPCCILLNQGLPTYIDYVESDPITGEMIVLHFMPTEVRLAIAYYHWTDSGAPEPTPMEYIYMSAGRSQQSAGGGMARYQHQYGEHDAVPWATFGDQFGANQRGYNWVDFLAGNSAEPTDYPGDYYSDYEGGDGIYYEGEYSQPLKYDKGNVVS